MRCMSRQDAETIGRLNAAQQGTSDEEFNVRVAFQTKLPVVGWNFQMAQDASRYADSFNFADPDQDPAGLASCSWVAGASEVTFELSVAAEAWVSLGVSTNGNMASSAGNPALLTTWDSATLASSSRHYLLTSRSMSGVNVHTPAADEPTFTILSSTRADGTSTVTFTLPCAA